MERPKCTAIIVAAGQGSRMGGAVKKQFLLLEGKPILAHTLAVFESAPEVDAVVLVLGREEASAGNWLSYGKVLAVVPGGAQRQDSVRAGLAAVPVDTEIVLVHDGVRPFVRREEVRQVIELAAQKGACVLAQPVKDTIKVADADRKILATPDRTSLWQAQTPQGFRLDLLRAAYENAAVSGATDDSALVESMGVDVFLLPGSEQNIKITTPWDLQIARLILKEGDFGQ